MLLVHKTVSIRSLISRPELNVRARCSSLVALSRCPRPQAASTVPLLIDVWPLRLICSVSQGVVGVAASYNASKDRYAVKLPGGETISIRASNLTDVERAKRDAALISRAEDAHAAAIIARAEEQAEMPSCEEICAIDDPAELASLLAEAPQSIAVVTQLSMAMTSLIAESGVEAAVAFAASPDAPSALSCLTNSLFYYRREPFLMYAGIGLFSSLVAPSVIARFAEEAADWMTSNASCRMRSLLVDNGALDAAVLALRQGDADYDFDAAIHNVGVARTMERLFAAAGAEVARAERPVADGVPIEGEPPVLSETVTGVPIENGTRTRSRVSTTHESMLFGALQTITTLCFGTDGVDGHGSAKAAAERRAAAAAAGALEGAISVLLECAARRLADTTMGGGMTTLAGAALRCIGRVCLGYNAEGAACRRHAFAMGYVQAAVAVLDANFSEDLFQVSAHARLCSSSDL